MNDKLFDNYGPPQNAHTGSKKTAFHDAPTVSELAAAAGKKAIFATPGHKGALCKTDVSEYGALFPAEAVARAEREAAEHYGVVHARISVGGASLAIKAAMMCARCDAVAPAFTHVSAFYGAELAGTKIFTFDAIPEKGLPPVPTYADYERAFDLNPGAGAAIVTSPDYFGRCADVKAIRKVCDERGKLLIADCAHGAHFASRRDIFPDGGERHAHFAALSAHKTLRALTQSAVGTVNDGAFVEAYDEAMELLGTTSPSYPLIASVQNAIAYERENACRYDALIKECERFYRLPRVHSDDPLRIVVDAAKVGRSGEELYAAMTDAGFIPETHYGDCVVFIVTLSDAVAGVRRLYEALDSALKER